MIRWQLMRLFAWAAGKLYGYEFWRGRHYGSPVCLVARFCLRTARRLGESAMRDGYDFNRIKP